MQGEGGILKIKKLIKRERTKRRNIVIISILIMAAMPYLVTSLNGQGVFSGWEIYFAFTYAALVDLLLFLNLLRVAGDNIFEFQILNHRARIKDGILKQHFTIQLDKILYVDVINKLRDDFEILIIMDKGKRNRKFSSFDANYVRVNTRFKPAYSAVSDLFPGKELNSYSMKRAGAKKYYYLYLLYKNAYDSKFTDSALDYVKRFMEEYDLS